MCLVALNRSFRCHYAAIPRAGRIAADVAQILADNCGLLAEAPPKTGLSMTETFDFVRPRVRLPKTFGMGWCTPRHI